MKHILKYRIETTDLIIIEMPKNAQVLDVQVQHGNPVIWVLVDDEQPKEKRIFEIYGTGNFIEKSKDFASRKYIGTYQLFEGNFVGHVFENVNKPL